jgi:hypothetical protein
MKYFYISICKVFVFFTLISSNLLLSVQGSDRRSVYENFFPYYIKYCSTTKYDPFPGKGLEGGKAGHAVWYLKGACPDYSNYPSGLKLCEAEQGLDGVGLSTNKGLKNTNFIVVPGENFFFYGGLQQDDYFKETTKADVIRLAIKKNIFKRVLFHEAMIPTYYRSEDHTEFISEYTLGTDYGIALARAVYCINIPVNRSIMQYVVEKANQLNTSYKISKGEKHRGIVFSGVKKDNNYNWNGIYNNCTHTIINILADLGVIKHKKTDQVFFSQLANIGIPSNTLLKIHKSINRREINIKKLYKNNRKNGIFNQYKWIPQQLGAFVEKISFHVNNYVFRPNDAMFIYPHFFYNRSRLIRSLPVDEKYGFSHYLYSGASQHIEHFKERVIRTLNKIKKIKGDKKFVHNRTVNINDGKSDYFKFIVELEKYLIKEQEKNNKFANLTN